MNFNLELYQEYRRAAGIKAKDGWFDVTLFPNGLYCFATRQELGINGRIQEHPMLNNELIDKESGKKYVIDGVNIHWDEGYYYYATLRDSKGSHAIAVIGNINCQSEWVLESLEKFKLSYHEQ